MVGIIAKNIASKQSSWLRDPCLPSFNHCFLPPVSTSWTSLPMKAMRNCVTCCYWPSRNAQKALAWHKGGSSCHIFLLSDLGSNGREWNQAMLLLLFQPPVCVRACPAAPLLKRATEPQPSLEAEQGGVQPGEKKTNYIYKYIYIFWFSLHFLICAWNVLIRRREGAFGFFCWSLSLAPICCWKGT